VQLAEADPLRPFPLIGFGASFQGTADIERLVTVGNVAYC